MRSLNLSLGLRVVRPTSYHFNFHFFTKLLHVLLELATIVTLNSFRNAVHFVYFYFFLIPFWWHYCVCFQEDTANGSEKIYRAKIECIYMFFHYTSLPCYTYWPDQFGANREHFLLEQVRFIFMKGLLYQSFYLTCRNNLKKQNKFMNNFGSITIYIFLSYFIYYMRNIIWITLYINFLKTMIFSIKSQF